VTRLRTLHRGLSAALLTAAIMTTGGAFAQPQDAATKTATEHFKSGTTLFQQRNFGAALEKFKASYATVPSPNSGLYIARCHAELGQNKEAYNQFRRVIAEAEGRVVAEPKYKPTLDTARREIEEVSNKIALVTVQVQNAAGNSTLRIGATAIPRDQWGQPLPLDPGPVDVVLDTVGSPPISQRHDLRAGERKTISIGGQVGVGLPPPPPPRRKSGTELELLPISLSFAGVGVAGMVMFGVGGGLSMSTYSEVEENCPNGPSCTDELIDRGETEQLIANIGVIIGGVGLAAGTTVFIIDVANGGSSSDAALPLNVAIGPGYVGLKGEF
jgi:hypothetical protein